MNVNEHTLASGADAADPAGDACAPGAAPAGTPAEETAPPPVPEPDGQEPRIETLAAAEPAPGADGDPLEFSDEAEEGAGAEEGGAVVDTELSRTLATPAGLRGAIEALLFVSPEPLTPHRIARTLEVSDSRLVLTLLNQIREDYDAQKRGMQVVETAEGYQMATREVFGDLILRLKNRKRRPALSPAALETLAIIAYRQPIIRAEVEAVRGVESSGTIRNLIDMGLVEMVGRKEVLGRPPMYGTNEQFLQSFGLRALSDLPPIGELKRRFAESEARAEQAAAATPAAAPAEEAPPPGDLPGQMLIEVPGDEPAGAPDQTEGGQEACAAEESPAIIMNGSAAPPEPADAEETLDGAEAQPDEEAETPGAAETEETTMAQSEPWDEEDEEEEDEEEEDEDELAEDEDEDDELDDEDDEDLDDEDDEDDEDLDDEDLDDEDEDEDFEDEDEDEEGEEEEDFVDQDLRDLKDQDAADEEIIVEDEEDEEDEGKGKGKGGRPKRRR